MNLREEGIFLDVIVTNGNIYTMEEEGAVYQAMLVRSGSVAAVGEAEDIRTLAPRANLVDLQGGTVLPSFTDAHLHFLSFGLGLERLRLEGASLEETLAMVKEAAGESAPGQWIIGRGFDANLWDCGAPRREWLDEKTSVHPVALISKDGHTVWLNQLAAEQMGITADTPDPKGGVIERDASGQFSGLCKETAADAIVSQLPEPTASEKKKALQTAIKHAHAHGITAVHTMEGRDTWETWQELIRSGPVDFRGWLAAPVSELDALRRLGLQGGFGSEYLRFGGVKIFADGSLGSQTAWMLQPYEGEQQYTGVVVTDEKELKELVRTANQGGIPVLVHAIGDGANRAVLNALEAEGSHGLINRIEHAQLLDPADVPRLAAVNAAASMQPTQCPMDRYMAERHWGERCRTIYPFRSLLDHGTLVAFGSDSPVESLDVMLGLYSAVARKQWTEPDTNPWRAHEAISVYEAIRAYTYGSAAAAGEAHYRGTLAPGQRADFVVLSQDILAEDPEILKETEVLATFFEGQQVFER